jgi:iron complex outermembrane recepter protein
VAPQQVSDADGSNEYVKSFKPERANQFEFGAKGVLFDEKLTGTISVYDIKVSNRVMPSASNPLDYTQGGKVNSRGFEIDLNAAPVQGLNIIAG